MTATITEPVVYPIPLARRRSWRTTDSLPSPTAYAQDAIALSYPLAHGFESEPRSPELTLVRESAPADRPSDADMWAATFLRAVIEVIACDRPLTQLVRWTNRAVYADIARKRGLVARHHSTTNMRSTRQQVATVRVFQPHPLSAEVAARLTIGPRSRALAARFDHLHDRWVCTALCFG